MDTLRKATIILAAMGLMLFVVFVIGLKAQTAIDDVEANGVTTLITIGWDGQQANGASSKPSISADGQYVAFLSTSTNLVPDGKGGGIFVRSRQLEKTFRASENGDNPTISADGQTVAFESGGKVIVRNWRLGDSYSIDGASEPTLSADGRFIAYKLGKDIFRRDLNDGTEEKISNWEDPEPGVVNYLGSSSPSISSNGFIIAYLKKEDSYTWPGMGDRVTVIFHDLLNNKVAELRSVDYSHIGVSEALSNPRVSSDGNQLVYIYFKADGMAPPDYEVAYIPGICIESCAMTYMEGAPDLSDDGRYVTFELLRPLANGVYVYDKISKTAIPVSKDVNGTTVPGANPAISGDGRFVAFQSNAANLVSNDTNGQTDIFIYDQLPLATGCPADEIPGTTACYVDVKSGNDSNPGTIDKPFKTIAKAVTIVKPGDIIYLREGKYIDPIIMNKSGSASAPITISAYRDEDVVVSGAIEVSNWSDTDGGGIYEAKVQTPINLTPEEFQVFVNGEMIHQAREPEIGDQSDPFSQKWIPMSKSETTFVFIQSANGHYLKAINGGGGEVYIDAEVPSTWEEFRLIDTNGGSLQSGDSVGFLTYNQINYLAAENGGRPGPTQYPDDVLVANRETLGFWEKFVIEKVPPGGEIRSGDTITLKAAKGGYLTADQVGGECGGGKVHANAAAIGNCEKFKITIQHIVTFDENDFKEEDSDFTSANNAWAGSYLWGGFGYYNDNGVWQGQWSLSMAKIIASSPGELRLGDTDEWWNSWGWNEGKAAIIGGIGALDTPGEWHFVKDSGGAGGTLYYMPTDGMNPNDLTVEIKRRIWNADVKGSYLQFSHIDFFGGQMRLVGNHNKLDNVKVNYGTHYIFRKSISEGTDFNKGYNGIYVSGNDNSINNSEIAYSAGNGVSLIGDRNTVANCLIHDFGYMGTYTGGAYIKGSNFVLTHSTLFNSGQHLEFLAGCTRCKITYNFLHDSNLLTNESGGIYSFGKNLEGTEIAYNWIQTVTGIDPNPIDYQIGIYLDNGTRNVFVHHNLITGLAVEPGLQANTPHEGVGACNNTIVHNNSTQFKEVGVKAFCSCNFDRAERYFEGCGECNHQVNAEGNLESWCTHPDFEYWINFQSLYSNGDPNPRRLSLFNTQYYTSFDQASVDLINPQEITTEDNGWEIIGDPDFRPEEGSSLVDAGTPCGLQSIEYQGQAPDLGAYENKGINWIPGYKTPEDPHSGPEPLLSSGLSYTCALKPDGRVDCWGLNEQGQANDQSGPFTQVTAGATHTCGLGSDGSVTCWGENNYGQTDFQPGPYTQIDAGGDYACGLTTDGQVECWGRNESGGVIGHDGPFSQISASLGGHTCGLTPWGQIECWGNNSWGQSEVRAGVFKQVSTGYLHTAALTIDGNVVEWGIDNGGVIPDGPFTQISAGNSHTCGLRLDGTIECWGVQDNRTGPYVQVSAGYNHTCGLKTDGSVDCWGSIEDQQEGPYGQYTPQVTPLSFTTQEFGDAAHYTAVHLADMNGDGRPEVLFGNRDADTIEIWRYETDRDALKKIDAIQLLDDVHDIKVADFDKDGDLDIVAGLRSIGLFYIENAGQPDTVGNWRIDQVNGSYTWQVLVADIDTDGKLDIFQGIDNGPINTFYGDGKGKFTQGKPVFDPESEMRFTGGFNAIDLNSDDRPDLIGTDGSFMRAFLNPSDRASDWQSIGPADRVGSYPCCEPYALQSNLSPSAADLDGNGVADQVAFLGTPDSAGPLQVILFKGSDIGQGLVWKKTVLDTILYPGWAGVSGVTDLDNDGNLDIYVGGWDRFNGLHVYFGDGKGGFVAETIRLDYGVGEFNSIAIGDINGDRVMDIVTNRYTQTKSAGSGLVLLFGSHDVFVPVIVAISSKWVASVEPQILRQGLLLRPNGFG